MNRSGAGRRNPAVRRRRCVAASALAACLLVGCTAAEPETVRPLIDPDIGSPPVTEYEQEAVRARLDRLGEEVAAIAAASAGGWETLDTDILNAGIVDVTIFSENRSPFTYAGGTGAASAALGGPQAVVTMVDGNAICWAMRLSGDPADPVIERGAEFDPVCLASGYGDDVAWAPAWPPAPEPPEGSQTGGEIPDPVGL